ncbi:MAG TPA: hypothetical protein VGO31_16405 [Microbacteriaceae bacterium]|jgi:hypothetical protein|nr:hypothetical protein [Microbacteriaceae bacterium]
MLLRFLGGACDGHEEEFATAPQRLVLTPNADDFLRALACGTPDETPEAVLAPYELTHLDGELGIATYEPVR